MVPQSVHSAQWVLIQAPGRQSVHFAPEATPTMLQKALPAQPATQDMPRPNSALELVRFVTQGSTRLLELPSVSHVHQGVPTAQLVAPRAHHVILDFINQLLVQGLVSLARSTPTHQILV